MALSIRFDANPSSIIGEWHVISDRVQDHDEEVWNSLRFLHKEAPLLFCKPSKRKSNGLSTLILCYTPSCRDVTRIRQSAEFIRRRVSLPYSFNFFSFQVAPGAPISELLFLHTPEGEIYRKRDLGWEVITSDTSANSCSKDPIPSEEINKYCIYFPSTEEDIAKMANEKGGMWMVFSNSMARHDACWLALVWLCKKGILMGVKASTSMLHSAASIGFKNTDWVILCYTANAEDREDVLRAAVAIRKALSNESILFYATDFPSNNWLYQLESVAKFKHTVQGGLYERDCWNRYNLVIPSWEKEDTIKDSSAKSCNLVPSEVANAECVYFPSTEADIAKMTNEKGGKWMVFNNSMARHDACWLTLVSLYKEGILMGLKASTSVLASTKVNSVSVGYKKTDSVILCYTANAEDKEDVLRAAIAIRNALGHKYMMFYKTNSASNSGLFRHEGKKNVTKFKNTVRGGLYERDSLNRFELVIPSCEKEDLIRG